MYGMHYTQTGSRVENPQQKSIFGAANVTAGKANYVKLIIIQLILSLPDTSVAACYSLKIHSLKMYVSGCK